MLSIEYLQAKFNLKPLPQEGGYYAESYRSSHKISLESLPHRYKKEKSLCTAIYYVLTRDTLSKLHRLPIDEIYHFYLGDPVQMLLLYPGGKSETIILGSDIESSHRLQFVVPQNTWQGSFLMEGGTYALMGTTMAPGFDFADYEPGVYEKLCREFPDQKKLIGLLTP